MQRLERVGAIGGGKFAQITGWGHALIMSGLGRKYAKQVGAELLQQRSAVLGKMLFTRDRAFQKRVMKEVEEVFQRQGNTKQAWSDAHTIMDGA